MTYSRFLVASFTDAWIETDNAIKLSGLEVVASFTDAWIETDQARACAFSSFVASFTDAWIETREGLLKISSFRVASFTDAWIETFFYWFRVRAPMSHLLQMRGLKQITIRKNTSIIGRIFYRCVD